MPHEVKNIDLLRIERPAAGLEDHLEEGRRRRNVG